MMEWRREYDAVIARVAEGLTVRPWSEMPQSVQFYENNPHHFFIGEGVHDKLDCYNTDIAAIIRAEHAWCLRAALGHIRTIEYRYDPSSWKERHESGLRDEELETGITAHWYWAGEDGCLVRALSLYGACLTDEFQASKKQAATETASDSQTSNQPDIIGLPNVGA